MWLTGSFGWQVPWASLMPTNRDVRIMKSTILPMADMMDEYRNTNKDCQNDKSIGRYISDCTTPYYIYNISTRTLCHHHYRILHLLVLIHSKVYPYKCHMTQYVPQTSHHVSSWEKALKPTFSL